MKTLLKISSIINLSLLAGLLILLKNGQKQPVESKTVMVPPRPLVNQPIPVAMQTSPQFEPKPFRWSQLDAKDYRVYVKNLRDIGCPEPTVRAIVAADVHAVFSHRGRLLRHQLEGLAQAPLAMRLKALSSESALKSELQQLPDAEVVKTADLLSLPTTSPHVVANVTVESQQQRLQSKAVEGSSVVMPLALQSIDHAGMNLDESQLQAINDLRQGFIDKIGGMNQDPNDPGYLARWQEAQPEVNSLMQGMIGDAAFQDYQLHATAQSSQSQGSVGGAFQSVDGSTQTPLNADHLYTTIFQYVRGGKGNKRPPIEANSAPSANDLNGIQ